MPENTDSSSVPKRLRPPTHTDPITHMSGATVAAISFSVLRPNHMLTYSILRFQTQNQALSTEGNAQFKQEAAYFNRAERCYSPGSSMRGSSADRLQREKGRRLFPACDQMRESDSQKRESRSKVRELLISARIMDWKTLSKRFF